MFKNVKSNDFLTSNTSEKSCRSNAISCCSNTIKKVRISSALTSCMIKIIFEDTRQLDQIKIQI